MLVDDSLGQDRVNHKFQDQGNGHPRNLNGVLTIEWDPDLRGLVGHRVDDNAMSRPLELGCPCAFKAVLINRYGSSRRV
jgi:hypothetical protein